MFGKRLFWLELLLVLIITIPLFVSLLNNSYFSMHDDQHVARLYLLDKAIHQGDLYPRWVDTLGFSFGYPLFNFYPPLIYFVAEIFHLAGFSLIWSLKLMLIVGFLLSVFGMHIFLRKKLSPTLAIAGATLYGYLSYHAILVYIRGAFAEFFAVALLPFVFLALENLAEKKTIRNAALFAISFGLLILSHPLIAFPFLIFLGLYGLFFLLRDKQKNKLLAFFAAATFLGLSLAAFFWLPAMFERGFTQVDLLSTTDLATYSLHYVCPGQYVYSPWGYGGSIPGCQDGLSFQIGKVYWFLFFASLVGAAFYWIKKKRFDSALQYYAFYFFLTIFSFFMTTSYSSFIWDNVGFLSYLQFPWRFLTFAGFFLATVAAFSLYFFVSLFKKYQEKYSLGMVSIVVIILTVVIYQKYFRPQNYISTSDQRETTFEKIAWDVSLTSLDFIPQGVPTRQLTPDRRTVDIDKSELQQNLYNVYRGTSKRLDTLKNTMREKEFNLEAFVPLRFWLHTFNFPGWRAYLNDVEIPISGNETFNLIEVYIPQGYHNLRFVFESTPVRTAANLISLTAIAGTAYLLLGDQLKKMKRRLPTWFDKSANKFNR